jgi:hypothetical protein
MRARKSVTRLYYRNPVRVVADPNRTTFSFCKQRGKQRKPSPARSLFPRLTSGIRRQAALKTKFFEELFIPRLGTKK